MFDRILAVGSVFDWVSPVLATVQDIVNGPSRTFLIPQACGWSGRDIIRLLHRRGVKTWGHMVVNDTIMITVKQKQAHWAQYLLEQAGILAGSGGPMRSGR